MDKLKITNKNGKWSMVFNGDSNIVDFFSSMADAFEGLFDKNDNHAKLMYNCFVAMVFQVAFTKAEAQAIIDECHRVSKKETENFLKNTGLL